MSYDLETIKAIPILDIANRLGLEFNRQNKTRCLQPEQHKNGDADPSLSYDPKRNILHCFVCGLTLDNIGLVEQVQRYDFNESCKYICDNFNITTPQPKPEPQLKEPKELSLSDKIKGNNFYKYLVTIFNDLKEGGKIPACWTLKTIKDLQIGFDRSKNCITYIYFNKKCERINIRWHKQKSISGHGGNILYPVQKLYGVYSKNKVLIFCEGEKDIVSLLSLGFQAVTSTNGSQSIPKDLSPLRGYKKIIISYDHDEAGKTGALKLSKRLKTEFPNMTIAIHHWIDEKPAGFDVTNFFESGGTKTQFENMLKSAEPYECLGLTGIDEPTEQLSNIITFSGQTLDEILSNNEPDPVPLISKGLLDPNSILLISGAPKTGKSILATNLALSLIAGRNWFDFEIPEPMNVAYFQAEMKDYRIRKRIKIMIETGGLKHTGSLFETDPLNFNILDDDYFKSLQKFIIENETNVLIFDPLISYHNSDENSNNEMQRVMERFRTLVNINNISLILVHHNRKSNETAGGQNTRGASSIFGAIDGLIEMRKLTDGNVKIFFNLRYDGSPDEITLKLNPETLWFEKVDINLDHNMAVLEILRGSATGMLKSDVVKKIVNEYGISRKAAYKWINTALKSKLIKVDDPKKKRNQLLFAIKNENIDAQF